MPAGFIVSTCTDTMLEHFRIFDSLVTYLYFSFNADRALILALFASVFEVIVGSKVYKAFLSCIL